MSSFSYHHLNYLPWGWPMSCFPLYFLSPEALGLFFEGHLKKVSTTSRDHTSGVCRSNGSTPKVGPGVLWYRFSRQVNWRGGSSWGRYVCIYNETCVYISIYTPTIYIHVLYINTIYMYYIYVCKVIHIWNWGAPDRKFSKSLRPWKVTAGT